MFKEKEKQTTAIEKLNVSILDKMPLINWQIKAAMINQSSAGESILYQIKSIPLFLEK